MCLTHALIARKLNICFILLGVDNETHAMGIIVFLPTSQYYPRSQVVSTSLKWLYHLPQHVLSPSIR